MSHYGGCSIQIVKCRFNKKRRYCNVVFDWGDFNWTRVGLYTFWIFPKKSQKVLRLGSHKNGFPYQASLRASYLGLFDGLWATFLTIYYGTDLVVGETDVADTGAVKFSTGTGTTS
jgi:hypothetical protein